MWTSAAILLLFAFASGGATDHSGGDGVELETSFTLGKPNSIALLIALQDGPAGEAALSAWSEYLGRPSARMPSLWVVCSDDSSTAALVRDVPHVSPLVMTEGSSWATALATFYTQTNGATVFGLLGEGVYPHPDLDQSATYVEQALARSLAPTAILTRSRSKGDTEAGQEWLPDTFIAQLWCNSKVLTDLELANEMVAEASLLDMLPRLLHQRVGAEMVVVDGTNVLPSVFNLGEDSLPSTAADNGAAADGGDLYIGTIDLALVVNTTEGSSGGEKVQANIATASWPPVYILEHVALEHGLIPVNSVNCGYLDFATNFLRSVQRVSDLKVLWVAMDETAFDFMDALDPGCATMFPSEGSERHRAIKAGTMGDKTFQSQVLVRPSILLHILKQGYTLLWTDSDMVWLGNPLPLLPDAKDPLSAELMLQLDGSRGNPCTCFLFMKPTETVKKLLVLWMESIVEASANGWYEDQIPFRAPLHQQRDAGMRMEIFPAESFPSGKIFFNQSYEENYAHKHFEDILIVHNNYIKGHGKKRSRFIAYHLWDVDDVSFPSCDG